MDGAPLSGVVKWFALGGSLKYAEGSAAEEIYPQFKKIQGLLEAVAPLGIASITQSLRS